MVRATYTIDENQHTLTVNGHANYAAYGKDIVCAGISSLVQALIGWLEEYHYKVENVSVDNKGGGVTISAEGEEVTSIFQMVAIGLEQIADAYPNHIQIDIIGTAD